MSIVNKKAPSFSAGAVINGDEIVDGFSLDQYLGKKYVVFFFYPKDFTYVCPTEILAYQELLPEFEKRDAVVVGCSTDTPETHLAWLYTAKKSGGIEGVTYPLVADTSKTIATNFGVLGGEYNYNESGELTFTGAPIALRGTFIIDKEGIVRSALINDFPIGRNTADSLRVLNAIQYHEKYGEVCPANWNEGDDAMKENRDSVASYLATH